MCSQTNLSGPCYDVPSRWRCSGLELVVSVERFVLVVSTDKVSPVPLGSDKSKLLVLGS